MSGLLLTRAFTSACYVYDTDGNAVATYLVPIGAGPFPGDDVIRTQVASPDGTVWLGVLAADASVLIRQITPSTGQILKTITVATITDWVEGYTLTLLPGGQFLVGGKAGGANTLYRVAADGSIAQTYSLPADTLGCFALAHDGVTLYYVVKGTTEIARWNLATDTAGPLFSDLGTDFEGQFVLTASDQVLGVYTSGSALPKTRLLNTDGSIAVIYTPSDLAGTGTQGGCAYELATNRVYMSMAAAGGYAGVLMAFAANDGSAPLWSVRVPILASEVFGRVVVTPPNGSPQPYPPTPSTTEPIYRMRQGAWLTSDQLRMFFSRAQVVMQTGSMPADGNVAQIALQWTSDGLTWSALNWVPIGAMGEYNYRVQFYQLGSDRNRAFRIMMTSNVPVAILEMLLEVEKGLS